MGIQIRVAPAQHGHHWGVFIFGGDGMPPVAVSFIHHYPIFAISFVTSSIFIVTNHYQYYQSYAITYLWTTIIYIHICIYIHIYIHYIHISIYYIHMYVPIWFWLSWSILHPRIHSSTRPALRKAHHFWQRTWTSLMTAVEGERWGPQTPVGWWF